MTYDSLWYLLLVNVFKYFNEHMFVHRFTSITILVIIIAYFCFSFWYWNSYFDIYFRDFDSWLWEAHWTSKSWTTKLCSVHWNEIRSSWLSMFIVALLINGKLLTVITSKEESVVLQYIVLLPSWISDRRLT